MMRRFPLFPAERSLALRKTPEIRSNAVLLERRLLLDAAAATQASDTLDDNDPDQLPSELPPEERTNQARRSDQAADEAYAKGLIPDSDPSQESDLHDHDDDHDHDHDDDHDHDHVGSASRESGYANDPDDVEASDIDDIRHITRQTNGKYHSQYRSDQTPHSPLTLTYSFADALLASTDPQIQRGLRSGIINGLNAGEISTPLQNSVREIFAQISQFTNLTFREVDSTMNANIVLIAADAENANIGGWSYEPIRSPLDAQGNRLSSSSSGLTYIRRFVDDQIGRGRQSYYVLMHEIGHALGLKHPQDLPDKQMNLNELTLENTVMSYNLLSNPQQPPQIRGIVREEGQIRRGNTVRQDRFAHEYGLLDRLALQAIYAPRGNTAGSGTQHVVERSGDFNDVQARIQDRGGQSDTLDLSRVDGDHRVDLNPGTFSDVGVKDNAPLKNSLAFFSQVSRVDSGVTRSGNTDDRTAYEDLYQGRNALSIAQDTVIENYVGGAGRDDVVGNDADNQIRGMDGDDTLRGGAGADTLIGGNGFDTASYERETQPAVIDRRTGKHTGSAENDQLDDTTENVRLTEGDDRFTGGDGDDAVEGGRGADTLKGGKGNDILVSGATTVNPDAQALDTPIQRILTPARVSEASSFGTNIVVSGRELFLADPGADGNRGRIYVYARRSDGAYVLNGFIAGSSDLIADVNTVASSSLASGERFGASLDVLDDVLIVGAPGQRVDSPGSVYLYRREGDQWTYVGQTDHSRVTTPVSKQVGLDVALVRGFDGQISMAYIGRLENNTTSHVVLIRTVPNNGDFVYERIVPLLNGQAPSSGAFHLGRLAQGIITGGSDIRTLRWINDEGREIGQALSAVDDGSLRPDTDFGRQITSDASGQNQIAISSRTPDQLNNGPVSGHVEIWRPVESFDPDTGIRSTDLRRDAVIFAPSGETLDGLNFGSSLALNGDTLVVGADRVNSDDDVVFVYRRDAQGNWNLVNRLSRSSSGPQGGELSVALTDQHVIVRWRDGVVVVYGNGVGRDARRVSSHDDGSQETLTGDMGDDRLVISVNDGDRAVGGEGVDTAVLAKSIKQVALRSDGSGIGLGLAGARADGVERLQFNDATLNIRSAFGPSLVSDEGMEVARLIGEGSSGMAAWGSVASDLGRWQVSSGGDWADLTRPEQEGGAVVLRASDRLRFVRSEGNDEIAILPLLFRELTGGNHPTGTILDTLAHEDVDAIDRLLAVSINTPPMATRTELDPLVATIGKIVQYTLPEDLFSNQDEGDELSYTARIQSEEAPAWLTFDPVNRILRAEATDDLTSGSQIRVTFVATDLYGATATATLDVMVMREAENLPPQVNQAAPALTAREGTSFSQILPDDLFSDPENETLTLSIEGLPGWLRFDPTTRSLAGVPPDESSGSLSLTLRATDPAGGSATQELSLLIEKPEDQPPQIGETIQDISAFVGEELNRVLPQRLFRDPEGEPLSWSLVAAGGGSLPDWLTFDPDTRVISGNPPPTVPRETELIVRVTDGLGISAEQAFVLKLSERDTPPEVDQRAQNLSVTAGSPLTAVLPSNLFRDDGSLTFKVSRSDLGALPDWLNFDESTRTLSGTPSAEDVGEIFLKVEVIDEQDQRAEQRFVLAIQAVQDTPIVVALTPADLVVSEGETTKTDLSVIFAREGESDIPFVRSLRVENAAAEAVDLPLWVQFDADTGALTLSPGRSDIGRVVLIAGARNAGQPDTDAVVVRFAVLVSAQPRTDTLVSRVVTAVPEGERLVFSGRALLDQLHSKQGVVDQMTAELPQDMPVLIQTRDGQGRWQTQTGPLVIVADSEIGLVARNSGEFTQNITLKTPTIGSDGVIRDTQIDWQLISQERGGVILPDGRDLEVRVRRQSGVWGTVVDASDLELSGPLPDEGRIAVLSVPRIGRLQVRNVVDGVGVWEGLSAGDSIASTASIRYILSDSEARVVNHEQWRWAPVLGETRGQAGRVRFNVDMRFSVERLDLTNVPQTSLTTALDGALVQINRDDVLAVELAAGSQTMILDSQYRVFLRSGEVRRLTVDELGSLMEQGLIVEGSSDPSLRAAFATQWRAINVHGRPSENWAAVQLNSQEDAQPLPSVDSVRLRKASVVASRGAETIVRLPWEQVIEGGSGDLDEQFTLSVKNGQLWNDGKLLGTNAVVSLSSLEAIGVKQDDRSTQTVVEIRTSEQVSTITVLPRIADTMRRQDGFADLSSAATVGFVPQWAQVLEISEGWRVLLVADQAALIAAYRDLPQTATLLDLQQRLQALSLNEAPQQLRTMVADAISSSAQGGATLLNDFVMRLAERVGVGESLSSTQWSRLVWRRSGAEDRDVYPATARVRLFADEASSEKLFLDVSVVGSG